MGNATLVIKVTKALTLTGLCFALQTGAANAAEPNGPDLLITMEDALEHHLISKIKTSISGKTEYDQRIRNDLVKFYQNRDRKPFWFENDKLTKQAKLVKEEIRNGNDYGLKVSDITFPDDELIAGTSDQRAEAELMMSHAVLDYAKRAMGGQLTPQLISRSLDNSPHYPEPLSIMEKVANSTNMTETFKGFHPKHPQYWALKDQLDQMRNSTGADKPQVKIPDDSTIQPFDKHPQIALLRQRLNVPVPTNKDGDNLFPENIYDSDLLDAVKNFQAANNVQATGIINRTTRAKLNQGKPNREKQLLANMERWRWVPREFGKTHIRVNIPEFLVRVTKNDKLVHTERVVTGKRANPTPSFSDEMETIVFNPYWNVPQSIIWNEMGGNAPKGFESRTVNGRVFIRQPPGPRNALGRVKFLFPNKHSVYMHDTPSKSLFNRKVRAFSHGCMRLRDPLKMAEVLLGSEGIDRKSINSRVGSGRNQYVKLKNKIPVHVTYFTMWVNKDGRTSYYDDIYGHDKRVIAALDGKPMGLEPKQRIARKPKPVIIKEKKKPTNFISLFFN